jgi:hypothetical protein
MTFKLYTVNTVINEFEIAWMETFVASLRHLVQTLGKLRKPRDTSVRMLGLLAEISVLGPIKY